MHIWYLKFPGSGCKKHLKIKGNQNYYFKTTNYCSRTKARSSLILRRFYATWPWIPDSRPNIHRDSEYLIPKFLTNTPINVCKVGYIGEFTGGHVIVKLAMYNVDDAGTEFSAKNSQKNHLMGIFAPISTFRPIGDQNYNSIR